MKMRMKYLLAFASTITMSVSAQNALFTISDGVDPTISVRDNGPGDQSSLIGAITVQTNMGVWALTISTAIDKPVVGSATSPVMDVNIQAESTAASPGVLTLTFSDNNFGPASGTVNATLTGNTVYGPVATANLIVYGNPANVVSPPFALPITVITGTPGGTLNLLDLTSSGSLNLPAPYSLTEEIQVSTTGTSGSLINLDGSFNLTSVPEPGIAALGCVVMGAWALFRGRKPRA